MVGAELCCGRLIASPENGGAHFHCTIVASKPLGWGGVPDGLRPRGGAPTGNLFLRRALPAEEEGNGMGPPRLGDQAAHARNHPNIEGTRRPSQNLMRYTVPLVLSYPWCMDETKNNDPAFAREWDADSANMERFQAGDEEAFEALVRSREREVYRTALRMLGSEEDALDASQETFIRAYRSLKSFRGEASFKTWIIGICINVCRNRLASSSERMKRKSTGLTKENNEDGEERDLPFADPSPDPSSAALGTELKAALAMALQKLSPEHREIIVLRDIQDLDYGEVSAILQCPEGTVKSRLCRARQALRQALEGIWP